LNTLVISLIDQDFVLRTLTLVASAPLDTSHAEIALTLMRGDVRSNAITGAFACIDGAVMGTTTAFTNTATIFSDEDFTRAGLEAFAAIAVPEPGTILLLGFGLLGAMGLRRKFAGVGFLIKWRQAEKALYEHLRPVA
jgi:hypothetical protein